MVFRSTGRRGAVVAAAFAASLIASGPSVAETIISRTEWGAHEPVLPMTKQTPSRITIHHTGVPSKTGLSLVKKLRNLQSFSQSKAKLADGRSKKPWADIPYHYYIAIDGKVGEGRPVGFVGDTNTKYDPSGHITIVVEGNFDRETPSPAELASLEALMRSLSKQYAIPPDRIGVHRDFTQTACPGKNLEGEVHRIVAGMADH